MSFTIISGERLTGKTTMAKSLSYDFIFEDTDTLHWKDDLVKLIFELKESGNRIVLINQCLKDIPIEIRRDAEKVIVCREPGIYTVLSKEEAMK